MIIDNVKSSIPALSEKVALGVFDRVKKLIKDDFAKTRIDMKSAFSVYVTKCCEKYGFVKTILYGIEPQFLYSFFVCPFLRYSGKDISSESVSGILNISEGCHFYIIQGNGGVGKSTLLKHFLLNSIIENRIIPVMIELKEFNRTKESFFDWIYTRMNQLGFSLKKEYFEYALEAGYFLFLFDGYDELTEQRQVDIYSELISFCDHYENNYYIMSTRPVSKEVLTSFQRFVVLNTAPLSRAQAIDMIDRLNFNVEVKDKFIERLKIDLYDTKTSFASNPLLLTIMLLTFDQYAEIPSKMHSFYSYAFEVLYQRHDATKGGYKREFKTKFDIDTFIRVLSNLCFVSYVKQVYDFTGEELRNYLGNVSRVQMIEFDPECFVYDLTMAVCILYVDGRNYRFIHRSFQEYFAALYVLNLPEDSYKAACNIIINKKYFEDMLHMLIDMNRDRFEFSIVLPILKEIEFTIKDERDRYYRYKDVMSTGISIHNRINNEEGYAIYRNIEDPKKELLFTISRHYFKINDGDYNDDELIKYVIKNPEKCDGNEKVDLSSKDVCDDSTIAQLYDLSWVGRLITNVSKLYQVIMQRKEESEKQFTMLWKL